MCLHGGPPAAAPEAAPATEANDKTDLVWMQEHRSDAEITRRLQAHTEALNLADVWSPGMVTIMEEMAKMAACPTKFISTFMPALICAAAGPRVRVSAWHDGDVGQPNGWVEVLNITCILSGRSGAGKSNAMREIKKEVKLFERIVSTQLLTTGFTIEAMLERIATHGSALALIDEGKKLRDAMNQYKGGKGDDSLVWMEMQNGEEMIIDRKGSQQASKKKQKKKGKKSSPGLSAVDDEADESDGEDEADEADMSAGEGDQRADSDDARSKLTSQKLVPHMCVCAGTHDKTVLDWRKPETDATDGKDARNWINHVHGTSIKLGDRDDLINASVELKAAGKLHIILTLIRMFCDDVLYAEGSQCNGPEKGLDFGLLEPTDAAYKILQTYYNSKGKCIDELAEHADGGHEVAVYSKARGYMLKSMAVLFLEEMATETYAALPALHDLPTTTTYEDVKAIALPHLQSIYHNNMRANQDILYARNAAVASSTGMPTTKIVEPTDYTLGCRLVTQSQAERAARMADYQVEQQRLGCQRWVQFARPASAAVEQLVATTEGGVDGAAVCERVVPDAPPLPRLPRGAQWPSDGHKTASTLLRQAKIAPFVVSLRYAYEVATTGSVSKAKIINKDGGMQQLMQLGLVKKLINENLTEEDARKWPHLPLTVKTAASDDAVRDCHVGPRAFVEFHDVRALIAAAADRDAEETKWQCTLDAVKLTIDDYDALMRRNPLALTPTALKKQGLPLAKLVSLFVPLTRLATASPPPTLEDVLASLELTAVARGDGHAAEEGRAVEDHRGSPDDMDAGPFGAALHEAALQELQPDAALAALEALGDEQLGLQSSANAERSEGAESPNPAAADVQKRTHPSPALGSARASPAAKQPRQPRTPSTSSLAAALLPPSISP